jgi:DNA-binding CsgD family transcriptional regulator
MYRLLTDRQGDILRMLQAGMTNRQIADALGVRRASVRHYRGF